VPDKVDGPKPKVSSSKIMEHGAWSGEQRARSLELELMGNGRRSFSLVSRCDEVLSILG
jgi:hypothetical protein